MSTDNKPSSGVSFVSILVILFYVGFIYLGINLPKQREKNKQCLQYPVIVDEMEGYRKALEQWRLDSLLREVARRNDSLDRIRAEKDRQDKLREMEEYRKTAEQRKRAYAAAATYSDGYRDGYECGYDDGDCNEGYGYSYLSDESLSRYSTDYRRGFREGYNAGISAGREDFEYTYDL